MSLHLCVGLAASKLEQQSWYLHKIRAEHAQDGSTIKFMPERVEMLQAFQGTLLQVLLFRQSSIEEALIPSSNSMRVPNAKNLQAASIACVREPVLMRMKGDRSHSMSCIYSVYHIARISVVDFDILASISRVAATARHNVCTVEAEAQVSYRTRVSREGMGAMPAGCVPQRDDTITTADGQPVSAR